MMKLICLAVFVAVASADVSHLFNKPPFQQRYQPYKPVQYYRPTPAPIAPLPVAPTVYIKNQPALTYAKSGAAGAAILRLDSNINPDGSYQYAYDTENGISAQESGALRQVDKDAAVVAQGSFQYTAPEGLGVQISYVADENGYQPSGNVLPTPHPIPEAIVRSIQYNEAHAERSTIPKYALATLVG